MEAPSQTGTSFRREVIKRIFAGNTVNLYLVLVLVSLLFIISLGDNASIALLVIQAVALLFSDRLVMGPAPSAPPWPSRTSPWSPSCRRPRPHAHCRSGGTR